MASQWQRLLKNSGTWVGSFTQISPQGEILGDLLTEVSLQPMGETMRQVIRKFPPQQPPTETVLEYRSLGRGVLFCDNGAFSQGSIQWSPVAEFGAELGLIHGNERLRLAQVFQSGQIRQLTLIREHLQGTTPTPRPDLSLEQLQGTWVGEAETIDPYLQAQPPLPTRLELELQDDHTLIQRLSFGQTPPLQSQGRLVGSALEFAQGSLPVTVLLLPDGASATFPPTISGGKPLFLELGWLIQPDLRQRLIRTYNPQGTWISLTLVTERKI